MSKNRSEIEMKIESSLISTSVILKIETIPNLSIITHSTVHSTQKKIITKIIIQDLK